MAFKDILKRLSAITPEIEGPKHKIDLRTKFIWTGIVVILYLIMTEIPLYGVRTTQGDPFQYTRIIFASSRGTLMELGIGPIVTSGLVLQLISGTELLKFDFGNTEDRALFTAATKLLTIVITVVEAAAYLLVGMFGSSLSLTAIIAIFIQLVVATLIVMMLDELIQKGWGLGSGISLFIVVGVAQTIFLEPF